VLLSFRAQKIHLVTEKFLAGNQFHTLHLGGGFGDSGQLTEL
jgi:hypothetical protein